MVMYYCLKCLGQQYIPGMGLEITITESQEGGSQMAWNLDDSRPIWPQIKDILTKDIVSGKYEMGGQFPTVRELAETAQVNRNTMQRALSELENDGLVISNRTAGRTVTMDEKLLQEIRGNIAKQNIEAFKSEMASLGFTIDQVITMMTEGDK